MAEPTEQPEIPAAPSTGSGADDPRMLAENIQREIFSRLRASGMRIHDAEDVVQEVCLRYLQAEGHTTISNPRAWAYRVSGNLLRDHYKQAYVRWRRGNSDSVNGLPAHDISPEFVLSKVFEPLADDDGVLKYLKMAYARLRGQPQHQETLMAWAKVSDQESAKQQLAAILSKREGEGENVTIDAAYMRLSRARGALRHELETIRTEMVTKKMPGDVALIDEALAAIGKVGADRQKPKKKDSHVPEDDDSPAGGVGAA